MVLQYRRRERVPLLRNRMSWVIGIGVISLACMLAALLTTPESASSTGGTAGVTAVARSLAVEPGPSARNDYYPSQFSAPTGAPEEPIPTF